MNPGSTNVERSVEAGVSRIDVFVSFDVEHDRELYELLLTQTEVPSFGFTVLGGSERSTATDVWIERTRRRIREADQVIVICGEHTESSPRVSAELRIAQEERIPYFLLWGRREIMCTKPVGAKPTEGMYSWTRQILRDQVVLTARRTGTELAAELRRNVTRKLPTSGSGVAR